MNIIKYMNNPNKKLLNFISLNKSFPSINLDIKYGLFFIFFISLFELIRNSEIKLRIQGGGEINLLNRSFFFDPSDVIVNGESKPLCRKTCLFNNDINNATIKFDDQINICENMFYGMENIIEIDLSNFDASNVISMHRMFSDCVDLQKITFGNINTSLVQNMKELFNNCIKLTTIDRLNFNTLSVKTMNSMFNHCESLLSINAEFNPENVENLFNIFAYCYKVVTINLPSFKYTRTINIKGIFYNDTKLKYVDLSNFEVSSSIETIRSAFRFCHSIIFIRLDLLKINTNTEIWGFLDSTYPDVKVCIKDENTINILNQFKDKINCSNNCLNENMKIDLKVNKCIKYCNESEYKYELNYLCYYKCPDNTFPIDKEYFCLSKKPEHFYLSKNENYKKCFDTCQSCDMGGDEYFNNCIECKKYYINNNGTKYNHIYELNLNGTKNCYIKCPYYFYHDKSSGIYYCTENKTCYGPFDKLIYELSECVNKCEENNLNYKYEFRKRCYERCPEGSIKVINNTILNDYFCKPICSEEKPYEYIYTQECAKYCPIKELKQNICIQNYKNGKIKEESVSDGEKNKEKNEEDTKAQDIMLKNIEIGFVSEDYDTSTLEKGEDDVFEDEKMIITLTTTQNQKNNTNNNMTTIDLGECEYLLRKEYNISENELLNMKKIDVIQDGMKIPKVEYDVYSKLTGNNLIKLNLTVCHNSKISISIPIKISENLDKLNISSGYYNDLCYVAFSDSGTDISLKDRKNEFIQKNKTVCQDDCDFSRYDYNTQKAKCLCNVKESSESFKSLADMKINKTKLYSKFIDIKNIANIKLITCYKELFNIKGIKKNIAFYVTIPVIILHIITIIIFYKKQRNQIYETLKNISFAINNWELVVKNEKEKRKILIQKRKKQLSKKSTINKRNKLTNIVGEGNLNKKNADKKEEKIKILNPLDFWYLKKCF